MKLRLSILLAAFLVQSLSSFAADTIIKPGSTNNPGAGKNMYLQTADNHLVPATVVYTTDGNGNIVPVSSSLSNINIGQVNQGTSNDGTSPWHVLDDQSLAKWNLLLPKFDVNLSTLASQATLLNVLGKLDVNLSSVASQATLSTLSGNVIHADTGNVTVVSSALPTGAATAANQTSAQTTLNSLDTKTPSLGQKTMAGSRPVVLASDQSAIPTKLQDGTGNALGSTSGSLNVNVTNAAVPIQGGNTSAVKVDGSAVTQPISAAALPLPAGASTEVTLSTLNSKVTTTANGIKVDGSAVTQPVSGTVTANAGTGTFSVSGTVNSKLQDGNGNVVTSQSSGFQRALDVGVNVAGVQVDPRQVRALTNSDTVTVVQPTASNLKATANINDGAGTAITSQSNGTQRALDVGINVSGAQIDPRQVRTLTATDVITASNTTGNIASGTADTGNPVKVGGKYNATAIGLSDGQRGDLQVDRFGNVAISQRSKYFNITANGTFTIKSSAGRIVAICINSNQNGASVQLFDNTAGSGTKIASYTTNGATFAPTCQYLAGAEFTTGLTVLVATFGSSDWTIYYE